MTMTNPPKQKRFTAISAKMRQMGKSAALGGMFGGGGPGSPVSLMTTHLKRLCVRYRQVKPFPLKPGEFFETVYPLELFLERTANDPRWVNLAKCLNVEPVAHFHVEGRDETHETFWVKGSRGIPVPDDLSITLLYPASSPHFDVVNVWVGEALETHERIDGSMEMLRKFINSVKHPDHVANFWPELMPFIGEVPETMRKHVETVKGKEINLPALHVRNDITDLLATCSLLSDVEQVAWVKFPENTSG